MMIVPVATAAGFVLGIKSAMSASDNIITLVISEQDELASQLDALEATPDGIHGVPKEIQDRLDKVKLVKKLEV